MSVKSNLRGQVRSELAWIALKYFGAFRPISRSNHQTSRESIDAFLLKYMNSDDDEIMLLAIPGGGAAVCIVNSDQSYKIGSDR